MPKKTGAAVVLAIVGAGVFLAVLSLWMRTGRGPRPIVLVTVDTLRADRLGAYGSTSGLTPRLDALAATGVVFDRCWTTAPLTVPAHVSMLTGLVPPLHGIRTNTSGRRLPPAALRPYGTVAEVLRGGGWSTGAFISASVLRADRTGLDAGFQVYDEVPPAAVGSLHDAERPGHDTVDAALEWVEGTDGRFFLWVHLFDPHAPYDAPPPWGAGAAHATDATGYDGEVRYADDAIGRLMDGLESRGHDPILVVTSDHGEGLGEHGEATHGHLLHEATLHVPLIIRAPGLVADGARRTDPSSVIDIAPTLVSLAGLGIPTTMDGRPLFAGGKDRMERAPYAETLYGWEGSRWAQVFALRIGDEKLVDDGATLHTADLAADPRETQTPRLPSAEAVPSPWAERREQLRRVAGLSPLAAPESLPDGLSGGSYWTATTSGAGALAPDRNARLPSPYDRMSVLALLDRGRAELAAGRAKAAAATFAEAMQQDAANPQAARWRARSLLASEAPDDAASAYRHAFALGWTHSDCVVKALQASSAAVEGGRRDEIAAGLAFLAEARGKGVPQVGKAFVLEAYLLHEKGDAAGARRALEHARGEPATPKLTEAILELEQRLR